MPDCETRPEPPDEDAPDPGADEGAPEPSLKSRVAKGAGWVFVGKVCGRGLKFLTLLVLARLLNPTEVGLFGLVSLAVATLARFTQTGFDTALIQKQDDTEAYLDTAWTVQVIRAFVVSVILFLAAPLIGWFYEEPRVVGLLRILCVGVAFEGFLNIGTVYFRKELKFHKSFAYEMGRGSTMFVVGVVLAYMLRDVRALIYAGVAQRVVGVVLSYVLHPYRPALRWDREKAGEMFRFGRWVLISSVLGFLIVQGDDAFMGKVLGAAALGVYQMAYHIANVATTEIAHTVTMVAFPAYSSIQDELPRFRGAFIRTLNLTLVLVLGISAVVASASPAFVDSILGPKWAAVVVPIQLLCLFTIARAYGASLSAAFYAAGVPRESTVISTINVILMAIVIYPLTVAYGIPGTCLAVIIGIVPAKLYGSVRICRILSIPPLELLRSVGGPLLAGAGAYAAGRALVGVIDNSWIALFAVSALAGAAFTILLALLHLMGLPSLKGMHKPVVRRVMAFARRTST